MSGKTKIPLLALRLILAFGLVQFALGFVVGAASQRVLHKCPPSAEGKP